VTGCGVDDQDLIGVTFKYVDGRILEVTGVHPKFPNNTGVIVAAAVACLFVFRRRFLRRDNFQDQFITPN
jgi:hypothetical protein